MEEATALRIISRPVTAETNLEETLLIFFTSFALLENTLIRNEFHRPARQNGDPDFIDVDWQKFARDAIADAPVEAEAIVFRNQDFLNDDPPKKLIWNQTTNEIDWRRPLQEQQFIEAGGTRDRVEDFFHLCVLVWRVRNNLFHGAKGQDSDRQTLSRLKEVLPILTDLRNLIVHLP